MIAVGRQTNVWTDDHRRVAVPRGSMRLLIEPQGWTMTTDATETPTRHDA